MSYFLQHWGIPLSRRFRALKLWFVIRNYGVEGLREYVRSHCKLAKSFEKLVLSDRRFEICNNVRVGLVCFRLTGSDELNQKLLSTINASGKLHMVPASVNEKYVIRFCVCAQNATEEDIEYAWRTIAKFATDVIEKMAAAAAPAAEDLKLVAPPEAEAAEEAARLALKNKRSFFVRMVSDPKIYNPKIVVNKMEAEEGFEEEQEGEDADAGDKRAAEHHARPDIRTGVTRAS